MDLWTELKTKQNKTKQNTKPTRFGFEAYILIEAIGPFEVQKSGQWLEAKIQPLRPVAYTTSAFRRTFCTLRKRQPCQDGSRHDSVIKISYCQRCTFPEVFSAL